MPTNSNLKSFKLIFLPVSTFVSRLFLHHPYYHNNQAAEVKDYGKIQELDVGSWTTSVGLDMKDDLFPHVTGGMRGRRIMVASLEVRI